MFFLKALIDSVVRWFVSILLYTDDDSGPLVPSNPTSLLVLIQVTPVMFVGWEAVPSACFFGTLCAFSSLRLMVFARGWAITATLFPGSIKSTLHNS